MKRVLDKLQALEYDM